MKVKNKIKKLTPYSAATLMKIVGSTEGEKGFLDDPNSKAHPGNPPKFVLVKT